MVVQSSFTAHADVDAETIWCISTTLVHSRDTTYTNNNMHNKCINTNNTSIH